VAIQDGPVSCDFCGKPQKNVKKLISAESKKYAGQLYICNECIEQSIEILYQDNDFQFTELNMIPVGAADMSKLGLVFKLRDFVVAKDSCLYLGPFGGPFNTIYRDCVVPALESADISVTRAGEIFSTDVTVEEVLKGIVCSSFVVADVSGRNPNVMYEIGMANAVGRLVLVISQSVDDIPFDLRYRRTVIYEPTPGGCRKLEEDLARTARLISTMPSRRDG
jgi:hypothetical protein